MVERDQRAPTENQRVGRLDVQGTGVVTIQAGTDAGQHAIDELDLPRDQTQLRIASGTTARIRRGTSGTWGHRV